MSETRTADQTLRIGTTPRVRVWERDRVSLWRYGEGTAAPGRPALLLVHGFVGRQTVLDLLPDRSVIRDLLARGIDVWAIDWGNHGPEDRSLGFADCVAGYLPHAIDAMGGAPPFLLGICQGGVIATMFAAHAPRPLTGLATAVTPIDFHADDEDGDPVHGMIHLWLRNLAPEDVDRLIATHGVLSGRWLGAVFEQLSPLRRIARYAVDLPQIASDPDRRKVFDAMELWLSDRPDMPGTMARELLVDLYQDNRLAEGRFVIDGAPVDLCRIRVPVLNVFALSDHIVPPPCSQALGRLVGSRDYSELAIDTGHIGVFVSDRARPVFAPRLAEWILSRM